MTETDEVKFVKKGIDPSPGSFWFLGILGTVIVLFFLLSLQWRSSLKIERVLVRGEADFTEKEIQSRAGIPLKSLLDTIDLSAVSTRLRKHPYLRYAQANRMYPDAISLTVQERTPVAAMTAAGSVRYVDRDGVVLPLTNTGRDYDLPMITGIRAAERTQFGEALESEDFFDAVSILDAAAATDSTLYHMISELNMNGGNDVVLYSADASIPILFGRGEAVRKFKLLQAFWGQYLQVVDSSDSHDRMEDLQYLDLRYADQVVAKWNNPPRGSFDKSSL